MRFQTVCFLVDYFDQSKHCGNRIIQTVNENFDFQYLYSDFFTNGQLLKLGSGQ